MDGTRAPRGGNGTIARQLEESSLPRRHFLAIDLGAETGRAVVGTLSASQSSGRTISLAVAHRFANPTARIDGRLQWDLAGQWKQIKEGIRRSAQLAAAQGVKLAGIGVDTWGVDFGLIGPDGSVLGNPVHYRDERTIGLVEEAIRRVGRTEIFRATGIQFSPINTLYQLMATCRQQPELIAAAKSMLFMPDLFHYRLSGRMCTEYTIATTSQMYDVGAGRWAVGLLEKLELPSRLLQEVVPPGTMLGPLLDEVAIECDIAPIPIIAPAGHDTACAVAAVPAEGEDWCYISSGTWSLIGIELARPVIDERTQAFNLTNEGGVAGTVRLLSNIVGLWLLQECRRAFADEGKVYEYDELVGLAESPADPDEPLVNLEHAPLLNPGDMPGKIQRYCAKTGQQLPEKHGQIARCCLASLALSYRKTLRMLEEVVGRRISRIHIVGGGSQNDLLNQMTADACGCEVLAGPVEATAIGNILVQAMAIGEVTDLSAARRIVLNSFGVRRFEARDTARWDVAWGKYQALPV
jgi:rhamnulokinase